MARTSTMSRALKGSLAFLCLSVPGLAFALMARLDIDRFRATIEAARSTGHNLGVGRILGEDPFLYFTVGFYASWIVLVIQVLRSQYGKLSRWDDIAVWTIFAIGFGIAGTLAADMLVIVAFLAQFPCIGLQTFLQRDWKPEKTHIVSAARPADTLTEDEAGIGDESGRGTGT